jgi:hypothetical protein
MSSGSLIDLLEVLLGKQMGQLVLGSPLSSFFFLFAMNSFICLIQKTFFKKSNNILVTTKVKNGFYHN